ncbi:hypothetical protein SNEBB_001874 [Seison nebaliae]|nr:hypothetical protein SNEBB_001874 [Seison nebaliae]
MSPWNGINLLYPAYQSVGKKQDMRNQYDPAGAFGSELPKKEAGVAERKWRHDRPNATNQSKSDPSNMDGEKSDSSDKLSKKEFDGRKAMLEQLFGDKKSGSSNHSSSSPIAKENNEKEIINQTNDNEENNEFGINPKKKNVEHLLETDNNNNNNNNNLGITSFLVPNIPSRNNQQQQQQQQQEQEQLNNSYGQQDNSRSIISFNQTQMNSNEYIDSSAPLIYDYTIQRYRPINPQNATLSTGNCCQKYLDMITLPLNSNIDTNNYYTQHVDGVSNEETQRIIGDSMHSGIRNMNSNQNEQLINNNKLMTANYAQNMLDEIIHTPLYNTISNEDVKVFPAHANLVNVISQQSKQQQQLSNDTQTLINEFSKDQHQSSFRSNSEQSPLHNISADIHSQTAILFD